jgi:hypothetical protein
MSWVYLPGPAEACLPPGCLDGGPSARSRLSPTASECSPSASATDISSPSRSGMTSARSMATPGGAALTSSAEASPARTSPAPATEQALQEADRASGLKCCASLAKFGLRLSSQKIAPISAHADSLPCWRGLPAWGMMRRGVCWALGTSAVLIEETGCGSLLPTPTGAGNEGSPSMQKWPAHRALNALLPTPIASDRNGDRQRGAGSLARGGGRRLTSIGGVFIALREWMMGWPLGWSACEPLATDRFQEWRRLHGKF